MAFSVSAFGLEEGDLPPRWIADRLDTLAFLNPEQITDCYPHSEIAYLDISNVAEGVVGKPAILSLTKAPSRAKRIVRPNDTILSTVRPGNRAYAFMREAPDNLIVSTGFVVLRAKPSTTDPRFVYYLSTSDPIIKYLASIAEEKTAYPSVNPGDIAECVVPIPPLPEQRAVAHILGTLDDKIELNRWMNETLEAIAHAYFKSWFVDFDPVRAKAEGRDPGLPKGIADLFPDSFEDSELGEIPKGWKVRPFSKTVEVIGGGTPKTSVDEYWNGDIPWFSVADVPNENDVFVIDTKKKINQTGINHSATRILPIGTTIISARGTVGKVALVGVPMTMNQSCYGLRGMAAGPYYSYFAARELIVALKQRSHGSVFDTITRNTLTGVYVILPPRIILDTFEGFVAPQLERIKLNLEESRTLASLRDALLPKLISGELRIIMSVDERREL